MMVCLSMSDGVEVSFVVTEEGSILVAVSRNSSEQSQKIPGRLAR